MVNEFDNTYYTLIADRAGNTYACAFADMNPISEELLAYINGNADNPSAEILFQYYSLVYDLFSVLANNVCVTNPIETAKLLCWLRSQYEDKAIDASFFEDKKMKREIIIFCDYFSSLSESALKEDKTYHAIGRRLRSIYPSVYLKYSEWDFLYEIKKISSNEEDIDFNEE